jgi:hypothetical protein
MPTDMARYSIELFKQPAPTTAGGWTPVGRPIADCLCGVPPRLLSAGRSYALGYPGRRLRLHPIYRLKTVLKRVDLLNRAVGPFGLNLPMFAVF